jgi:serine/threonine protein kinase
VPYDGAVDVYALGVTLYEMLTGELPFAVSVNEWLRAMMRAVDAPVPMRRFPATVPASIDEAVRRALARDPRERPSAAELGAILASLSRDGEHEGPRATVTTLPWPIARA